MNMSNLRIKCTQDDLIWRREVIDRKLSGKSSKWALELEVAGTLLSPSAVLAI